MAELDLDALERAATSNMRVVLTEDALALIAEVRRLRSENIDLRHACDTRDLILRTQAADHAPVDDAPAFAIPASRFDRVLGYIPRVLASKAHVLALTGLGIFLVILPLLGIAVSAQAELVGGNYTNVTSDIGACIAAGGTLHLVRQGAKRHRLEDERLRLARETHALLHHVHASAAAELEHEASHA